MDNIKQELKRIQSDGNCGVIIEETPEIQGFMYAVFSKEDGSVITGHWICHNTPSTYLDDLLNSLKNI